MPKKSAYFPDKAQFLFAPMPYKVLHGGRGAAKTWAFARALLILGYHRKLFILCAREIQKSISESVHKVLSEQITELGLDIPTPQYPQGFYRVTQNSIDGANGTHFAFAGIRNNVNAIKSMEGIDICAVFEATFVSQYSWEILLPTVRRDPPFGPFGLGSEVWVEFNPELDTDYTYQRWLINPPPLTRTEEMNWRDNHWFPETLVRLKDAMKEEDLDNYMTIWEGKTRKALKGAVYAKELGEAIMDGRINRHITYDKSRPLTVSFDLGKADACSMWFVQQVGMDHYVVDFYENTGYGIDHYLEQIDHRKYSVQNIFLPHDGTHETQAASKSILRQVKELKPNTKVQIIPATNPNTRINAVRQLFPRLYFNEGLCSPGILCLQHYRYEIDPNKTVTVKTEDGQMERQTRSVKPVHDWSSHAADSLGHYALGLREHMRQLSLQQPQKRFQTGEEAQSWMAG